MKRSLWGMMVLLAVAGSWCIIAGLMRAPEPEAQWQTWNARAALSVQENAAEMENNQQSKQANAYTADEQASSDRTGASATADDTAVQHDNGTGTNAITDAPTGTGKDTASSIAIDSNHSLASDKSDDKTMTNGKADNDAMMNHNDDAADADNISAQNGNRSSNADRSAAGQNGHVSTDSRISINEAGVNELTGLPGIGEKKAQAIIDYRRTHGKFRHINELDHVKGIGSKMLAKMLPYVKL
ncbi:helix-hairpin-helix domain-containing protein [Paenibacillus campi]|uniref:ComEA family DNA-binding protein n=1 Tax=Paenibacillus campi TaxID=3106031 RepID=UPI002AFF9DDE|nr:helix-hairpin-helix domain-containing protein [Paenibacillus sp. SGZ-1009]